MLKNVVFACCSETELIYEVCTYKGHTFRVYPNGKISKANAQEKQLAIDWRRKV